MKLYGLMTDKQGKKTDIVQQGRVIMSREEKMTDQQRKDKDYEIGKVDRQIDWGTYTRTLCIISLIL